jgi:primosomal protein N''
MKYISLFFLALIINFSIFAEVQSTTVPNIVAIVNDTPITIQEFKARKLFLKFVNNVNELTPSAEDQLNRTALKTLVDEQLFFSEAKKFKMDITEQEINNSIRTIEKNNNMLQGQFIANLKAHGISVESLKRQVKAQLIKEKLFYEFSRNIDINRKEINEAAELANKEYVYNFKKLTSIQNDKASKSKMNSLKKKINSCQIDSEIYKNIAQLENINIVANKLNEPLKGQSLKIKVGQPTDVFTEGDHIVFYVLCAKEIGGIKENEYDYIANALANKKISILVQKFYEKIKRKSYIKIFLK